MNQSIAIGIIILAVWVICPVKQQTVCAVVDNRDGDLHRLLLVNRNVVGLITQRHSSRAGLNTSKGNRFLTGQSTCRVSLTAHAALVGRYLPAVVIGQIIYTPPVRGIESIRARIPLPCRVIVTTCHYTPICTIAKVILTRGNVVTVTTRSQRPLRGFGRIRGRRDGRPIELDILCAVADDVSVAGHDCTGFFSHRLARAGRDGIGSEAVRRGIRAVIRKIIATQGVGSAGAPLIDTDGNGAAAIFRDLQKSHFREMRDIEGILPVSKRAGQELDRAVIDNISADTRRILNPAGRNRQGHSALSGIVLTRHHRRHIVRRNILGFKSIGRNDRLCIHSCRLALRTGHYDRYLIVRVRCGQLHRMGEVSRVGIGHGLDEVVDLRLIIRINLSRAIAPAAQDTADHRYFLVRHILCLRNRSVLNSVQRIIIAPLAT